MLAPVLPNYNKATQRCGICERVSYRMYIDHTRALVFSTAGLKTKLPLIDSTPPDAE